MECGECTLCCDTFPVKWLNKPANTKCKHCDNGCLIQDTKEKECRDFDCAYVQMKKVHIDMRPDNCNVIFERLSNRIFYGTIKKGYKMTEEARGQVEAFANEGFSVILHSFEQKKPIIRLGYNHDINKVLKEFKELIPR